MRLLSTVAALSLSASLFAFPNLKADGLVTYTGSGEWKSTCGAKGTFTETLKFGDHEMTGTVSVEGKTFTYRLAAVAENNGFFQVTAGKEFSAVIGKGYSFGPHVWRYGVHSKEGMTEESLVFHDQDLYTMGSKHMKAESCEHDQNQGQQQHPHPDQAQEQSDCHCGGAVAWQSKLTLQKP